MCEVLSHCSFDLPFHWWLVMMSSYLYLLAICMCSYAMYPAVLFLLKITLAIAPLLLLFSELGHYTIHSLSHSSKGLASAEHGDVAGNELVKAPILPQ